jgi:predicted adenine nucleotide alpha hydrolase (AANH) superfamily ATPase
MKILLHICCGPCAGYPVEVLRAAGHEVTGFWYNPNVHPYQEYARRLEAARSYAEQAGLRLIVHDEYSLRDFLRAVVFREDARCRVCYEMRLRRTAAVAKGGHFDAFTTTLLVSPHQQHELIRAIGEQVAAEVSGEAAGVSGEAAEAGGEAAGAGVRLHYEDFRPGFKQHHAIAERYGLYRQQYCGCIYSEHERFGRKAKGKATER